MGHRCTRIQNMTILVLIEGLAHDLRLHTCLGLKISVIQLTKLLLSTDQSHNNSLCIGSNCD